MTARCRYVIDIATGLALEAQCTNEVLVDLIGGPQRILDQWSITQTPPLPSKRVDSSKK